MSENALLERPPVHFAPTHEMPHAPERTLPDLEKPQPVNDSGAFAPEGVGHLHAGANAIVELRNKLAAGHISPNRARKQLLDEVEKQGIGLDDETMQQVHHLRGHMRLRDKKWFKPIVMGGAAIMVLLGMLMKRATTHEK